MRAMATKVCLATAVGGVGMLLLLLLSGGYAAANKAGISRDQLLGLLGKVLVGPNKIPESIQSLTAKCSITMHFSPVSKLP